MLNIFSIIRSICIVSNRLLYGGSYMVRHTDCSTGQSKVFWCDTWQDAIEWVSCALNSDRVVITDTCGCLLACRGA